MKPRGRKWKIAAQNGFVLIASILVISLLTILLVASMGVSQIEIHLISAGNYANNNVVQTIGIYFKQAGGIQMRAAGRKRTY